MNCFELGDIKMFNFSLQSCWFLNVPQFICLFLLSAPFCTSSQAQQPSDFKDWRDIKLSTEINYSQRVQSAFKPRCETIPFYSDGDVAIGYFHIFLQKNAHPANKELQRKYILKKTPHRG